LETCRSVAAKVPSLKTGWLRGLSAEAKDWLPENLFRQAFVEAEALAWSTPFPLLFLPALAEEKVRNIEQWRAGSVKSWTGGILPERFESLRLNSNNQTNFQI